MIWNVLVLRLRQHYTSPFSIGWDLTSFGCDVAFAARERVQEIHLHHAEQGAHAFGFA
jgi:hypothetical protein